MTNTEHDHSLEALPRDTHRWRTGDVGRAALVVFGVWFGLQLLWSVSSLFFLVFLSVLFGLAVGRGVDFLQRYRIRRGVASALIVFGTLAVIGGGLALSAPTLIEQGKELQTEFPDAVSKVQDWIDSKQRTGAMGALIKAATQPEVPAGAVAPPPAAATPGKAKAVSRPSDAIKQKLADGLAKASGYLFSFVSSTLAVLAAFFLLVFLAIYVGAEPEVYRGWMLAAIPAQSRPRARLILSEIANVLRKWLVTQLIAMVVIGTVCTVVLLILGVKAPFALGFIAGLMEFIPNLGPVLSAVPAVVMGFVDSPEKAAAVALAYWAIQFLENNLLIPYLMRGEMDLPPAITLVGQALMAVLFGFLGLMVAVPLIAVVLVPIRMIAERENAREKELLRVARRTGDFRSFAASMRVTAEHALAEADRGPNPGDLAEDDT
ncbi:MAG: AI-2E family transporter [Gemmatimonadaceae bacterium]|nr:AI-2E family transporter [Gemmatimonadaceae bacterium]